MQVFDLRKVKLFIFLRKRLAIRTTVRTYFRGNWHSQGGVRRYNFNYFVQKTSFSALLFA